MTADQLLACGGLTLDWVKDATGVRGPTMGGNALYSAVGAWLAGASVTLVAVAGVDYPAEFLSTLEERGLSTVGVRVTETPSFRVMLDESGSERQISYLEGSGNNAQLDPLPDQIEDVEVLAAHVAAIPTTSQERLIEALEDRAKVITLDTVFILGQIEPQPDEIAGLARRCSAFVPSREELHHLWPGLNPKYDVADMCSWLAPINVVKLGAEGSCGSEGDRVLAVPAFDAEVVDTTGAGDSYCGALCAALARGEDLAGAMAWATAAASLVVGTSGGMGLLTGTNRVEARRRFEQIHSSIS